jgi:hypothetical protein
MKLKKLIPVTFLLIAFGFLSGCETTVPKGSLQITPEALEKRQLQTRVYENVTEDIVISASVGIMQDLGYTIKETESKLGLVVGEKDRDATEAGQVALAILGALVGASTPIDSHQKIKISLVVSPVRIDDMTRYQARIALQRIVWNTQNQISKIESLDDKDIYEDFFTKLDKALFLEKNL